MYIYVAYSGVSKPGGLIEIKKSIHLIAISPNVKLDTSAS